MAESLYHFLETTQHLRSQLKERARAVGARRSQANPLLQPFKPSRRRLSPLACSSTQQLSQRRPSKRRGESQRMQKQRARWVLVRSNYLFGQTRVEAIKRIYLEG